MDLSLLIENPELAKHVKLEVTASDLLSFSNSLIEKAVSELKSKQKPAEERYLTSREVCDMLHISEVTLIDWDKKHITHPAYVAKRKYYKNSDLVELLSSKQNNQENPGT